MVKIICKLKILTPPPPQTIVLEIWWRGIYPQNLAWVHAAVSEEPQFAGRLTDDGRLRHHRSSAGKVKQS